MIYPSSRTHLALFICFAVITIGGCAPSVPEDAVAVYDGGYVTAAEAQRYMAWVDTSRLRTDAAVDSDEGVSELMAELAFLKILADEAGDEPSAQSPLYVDKRGSMLVQYYIERMGKRSHEVTDEEAFAFYEEHLEDRFSVPERIKFQHIFLRADLHSADELIVLERQMLDQIAASASFADLAATHSESGSATREGVVGPVLRGHMEPVFEDQVYSLDVGRPGVIRTQQGTHVVNVLEKRAAEVLSFEAVKRQIASAIMDRRNEGEREQLMTTLRARYGVEDRSAEDGLGPEDVVVRIKDRSMTLQQLDANLPFWLSDPMMVAGGNVDRRQSAADQLITANLLYLDAVDSGLDQEREFLDRWAMIELRRRSNLGLKRRLENRAQEFPEEEVLQYYRANEGRFAVPQRFQGSFLYKPFGGTPPFELQQEIERVAELAASPDVDPEEFGRACAAAGVIVNDMGWMTPLEAARVDPEFQRRLLAMSGPGSTGAFKGGGGLYVILVQAVENRRPMTLPEDIGLVRARCVELQSAEIQLGLRQELLEERHFEVLSTALFANTDETR